MEERRIIPLPGMEFPPFHLYPVVMQTEGLSQSKRTQHFSAVHMTWRIWVCWHVFSQCSSSYWSTNSGLLKRGTMNQLVYGSSNSFGQMSIMPLEETNWVGGEGIIDHNNPITLHNNTQRSTDWFKCLSRWYADEFWCPSVRRTIDCIQN